jgi:hypothetical protein
MLNFNLKVTPNSHMNILKGFGSSCKITDEPYINHTKTEQKMLSDDHKIKNPFHSLIKKMLNKDP